MVLKTMVYEHYLYVANNKFKPIYTLCMYSLCALKLRLSL